MTKLGVLAAIALALTVLPVPRFEFLPRAVADRLPLPAVHDASAEGSAAVQTATTEPLGGDRVQATDDSTPRFTVIGLTFDKDPGQPVLVRTKDGRGAFGPWHELHPSAEEGPDGGTSVATEPFWVGDGTGYEINMGRADAPAADVVLVHEEKVRAVASSTPVAGAYSNSLGVHSRDEWGARPSTGVGVGSTVKMAVVHHSASSNSYNPGDVPGILRGIQAFHMDSRGWSDIGYNFVVDKFGTMWEAREGSMNSPIVGAHALGFNTNTVGVMVLGDYLAATPSAAALEGVSKVVGWKLGTYGVEPLGTNTFVSGGNEKYAAGVPVNFNNVVGHQDTGSTDCPGSVENYLPQIRARASEVARLFAGAMGNLDSLAASGSSVTAQGWAGSSADAAPLGVTLSVGGVTVTGTTGISRPDVRGAFPALSGSTGFSLTARNVPPGVQTACVTVTGSDRLFGCSLIIVDDPAGTSPTGRLGAVTPFQSGLFVQGSVRDPDASPPGPAQVEVDGVAASVVQPGADGNVVAGLVGVRGGQHLLCIRVRNRNAGVDTVVDCRGVNVPGGPPFGFLDTVAVNGRRISLAGWAVDPETTSAIDVHITLDGRASYLAAGGLARPDVGAALMPGYGPNHGFARDLDVAPGNHTVCAVAINVGQGSNTYLGCRNVVVK